MQGRFGPDRKYEDIKRKLIWVSKRDTVAWFASKLLAKYHERFSFSFLTQVFEVFWNSRARSRLCLNERLGNYVFKDE